MTVVYPRAEPVKVKLVRVQGQSALIQWHDGQTLQRAYIPHKLLYREEGRRYRSDEYLAHKPEQGIPHGMPWGDLVRLTATPDKVEAALHSNGIFTAEDLETNHVQALAAFTSLYARDLKNLMDAARDHRRRTHSSDEE